jgi:O-antigen biosynthesis protein
LNNVTRSVPSLTELYLAHQGKVSDKWASYLTAYDDIFGPYRERPMRILEIGVQNGGSLEIWSRFFPKAEHIVGCDNNSKCENLKYDDLRISVVVEMLTLGILSKQ